MMKTTRQFFYSTIFGLSACSNFAQMNNQSLQGRENELLDFNQIINCDSSAIIKDSFDYYFNQPDDLINSTDGLTLSCGLRLSNNKFKREYYHIEADSTILIVKKMNLQDSSYLITFLKNQPIETIEGELRGCWNEYFMKIEYDKNGILKHIIMIHDDEVIKPKRIMFR